MNLKKIFSLLLVTLFSIPSLHASSHLKKAAVTTLFAASTLSGQSEKKEKVIKNRKGETLTFHGDGTVSVRDIFNNDLGVHLTNNDNPLAHQSIELVKEGDKSGVFVGLGLHGGGELISAVDKNNLSEVKRIMEKNSSSVMEKDCNGWFPLYIACTNGRYNIAKAILDNKYGLYTIDMLTKHTSGSYDHTPLTTAVINNHPNIVKLLISYGVKVDTVTKTRGMTAAHYAAGWKRIECLEMLVKAGADLYIKCKKGKTVFDRDENNVLDKIIKKNSSKNSCAKPGHTILDVKYSQGPLKLSIQMNSKNEKLKDNLSSLSQIFSGLSLGSNQRAISNDYEEDGLHEFDVD